MILAQEKERNYSGERSYQWNVHFAVDPSKKQRFREKRENMKITEETKEIPIDERIEKLEWQFNFLLKILNVRGDFDDRTILSMNDYVKRKMNPLNPCPHCQYPIGIEEVELRVCWNCSRDLDDEDIEYIKSGK